MGNEIFEEIKRKYEKSKKLPYFLKDSFYVDKSFFEDMGKLIRIIEVLEDRNKSNSRYIKELEEQHIQDCK